jgi:hypothetical protein
MAILDSGMYFGPGSNPGNRMEARNTQLSKTLLRIKLMKKRKIKIRKQSFDD